MLIKREGNSIIEAMSSHLETGLDLSLGKDSEIAFPGLHKKSQLWEGLSPCMRGSAALKVLKGEIWELVYASVDAWYFSNLCKLDQLIQ